MKPVLEKIAPSAGSSFRVLDYGRKQRGNCPPSYHFHPEFEIVYLSNGRGKRFINQHVSWFEDGDLIVLGPDLPHYGFDDEINVPFEGCVVQMVPDFLGASFWQIPEMHRLRSLFERSRQGLSYYGETRRRAAPLLLGLSDKSGFDRLLDLLRVLHLLARSEEYESLNASGFEVRVGERDRARLQTITELVSAEFRTKITLERVAARVQMSVPAFCRYFKKLTGKTFTRFVNEFRIQYACQLLTDTEQSVAEVCFASGFRNLSYFNKTFKQRMDHTPLNYRRLARVVRRFGGTFPACGTHKPAATVRCGGFSSVREAGGYFTTTL